MGNKILNQNTDRNTKQSVALKLVSYRKRKQIYTSVLDLRRDAKLSSVNKGAEKKYVQLKAD